MKGHYEMKMYYFVTTGREGPSIAVGTGQEGFVLSASTSSWAIRRATLLAGRPQSAVLRSWPMAVGNHGVCQSRDTVLWKTSTSAGRSTSCPRTQTHKSPPSMAAVVRIGGRPIIATGSKSPPESRLTKKARRKGPQRANSGSGIVGRWIDPFRQFNSLALRSVLPSGVLIRSSKRRDHVIRHLPARRLLRCSKRR
jgi:hypothetical protein